MKRRYFLISSFAAAMGLTGLSTGYFDEQQRVYKTIYAVFKKRLGNIKWTDEMVETFYQSFIKDRDNWGFLGKTKKFSYIYPVYAHTDLLSFTPIHPKVQSFEERIISKFLLSTDFFWNGADSSKALTYQGYHDPHDRPCVNPFANLS